MNSSAEKSAELLQQISFRDILIKTYQIISNSKAFWNDKLESHLHLLNKRNKINGIIGLLHNLRIIYLEHPLSLFRNHL